MTLKNKTKKIIKKNFLCFTEMSTEVVELCMHSMVVMGVNFWIETEAKARLP